MARNGSGTYALPSNSFNPAVVNTTISPTAWNATASDLATALTQSIASDGQTPTSARIPFANGLSINAGAVGAPGLCVASNATTGIYLPATGQLAITAAGVQSQQWSATGSTIPGTLGVTGVTTGTGGFVGNLTGNVAGNVTGNADTATKWATARTLSITGDLA